MCRLATPRPYELELSSVLAEQVVRPTRLMDPQVEIRPATSTPLNGVDSCAVEVQFAPADPGAATGSLDVSSDAGDVSSALSGTGLAAATLAITPVSIEFGDVVINQTSAAQTVTVTNTGTVDVTIGTVVVAGADPGSFTITPDNCSDQTLAAKASCDIGISFSPDAIADFNALLQIPSDAPSSIDKVVLTGAGLANEADLTIFIEPIDEFAAIGDTFGYIIMVTNLGPADVLAASVSGDLDAALSGLSWTCVADTGASCAASGSGDLNDESVDLANGSSVTFIISASVGATGFAEQLTSSATALAPMSPPDPDESNNSDEVTTQSGLFADGFEGSPGIP